MGKPEGTVENYLRKRAKEEGLSMRKLRWIGRRGAADNLLWREFPSVALVECKAPGEEVDWRSLQGREFRRMERDGWPVYQVNSFAQVDDVIERVKHGG